MSVCVGARVIVLPPLSLLHARTRTQGSWDELARLYREVGRACAAMRLPPPSAAGAAAASVRQIRLATIDLDAVARSLSPSLYPPSLFPPPPPPSQLLSLSLSLSPLETTAQYRDALPCGAASVDSWRLCLPVAGRRREGRGHLAMAPAVEWRTRWMRLRGERCFDSETLYALCMSTPGQPHTCHLYFESRTPPGRSRSARARPGPALWERGRRRGGRVRPGEGSLAGHSMSRLLR